MGLFGGILKGVTQVLSPIAGTIIGARDNKKAINKANAATQLGITNATGALNDQLATTTANYQPYLTAGTGALGQESNLLGLNGNEQQGSAISALQASPLFQTIFNTGRDSILAAGSATGGLRGGNVNDALYKNGQQTLAQVIQQQLQNLGGLSSQGLNATGQLGNFGAQNAGQIAGLDTSSGSANAGAILGKQAVQNNMFSQLQGLATSALSGGAGGGISSLLGIFGGGVGGGLLGAGSGGTSGGTVAGHTYSVDQLKQLFDASYDPTYGVFHGSGSGHGADGGALPNFPQISVPGF